MQLFSAKGTLTMRMRVGWQLDLGRMDPPGAKPGLVPGAAAESMNILILNDPTREDAHWARTGK